MASFNALDDDLVVSVASYGAPEDLLNLALTCRRLGSKMGAATQRELRALARDAKRQKASLRLPCRECSLVDEAARSAMEETQTVEERACLPLRDGDSWMVRYSDLIMLRRPLTFDQLGGGVDFPSEDKSEVRIEMANADCRGYCTALSNYTMHAGRHYASFAGTGSDTGAYMRVGVFRPININMVIGRRQGPYYGTLMREMNRRRGYVNYCAIDFADGQLSRSVIFHETGRSWVNFPWPGQEIFGENDTAGLLLDLDEGTLTVYKNERKLGVAISGLTGEYCWGASLSDHAGEQSVKITRGAVPDE